MKVLRIGELLAPRSNRETSTAQYETEQKDSDLAALDLQLQMLQAQNTTLEIDLADLENRLDENPRSSDLNQPRRKEVETLRKDLEEKLESKENELNPYCGTAEYEREKTVLRYQIAELSEQQESQTLEAFQLSDTIEQREKIVTRFKEIREQHAEAVEQLKRDKEASLPMDNFADQQIAILEKQLSSRQTTLEFQCESLKRDIKKEKSKLSKSEAQVESIYKGLEKMDRLRLVARQSSTTKEMTSPVLTTLLAKKAPVSILKNSPRNSPQKPVLETRARRKYVSNLQPVVEPKALEPKPAPGDLRPKRGRPILQGVLQKRATRSLMKVWKDKYAIVYRCDECYQLRLADSIEMKKASVYNIVAHTASLRAIADSPNQENKTFQLMIDPSDPAAPVLMLSAGFDYHMWWNTLMDAIKYGEISTTTSLDVSLQSHSSDSSSTFPLDLIHQMSV